MAEMQYNPNNYDYVINKINKIMKRSNCGLPQGFKNVWTNGIYGPNIDQKNLITWQYKLIKQLKINKLTCNNIQVAFDMGKQLYDMYDIMKKIYGPLGNYYNACLWEVTALFLNMMNDILVKKNILLTPDVQWRMNDINNQKTSSFRSIFMKQTQRWNRKYYMLMNAYEKSQRTFYKFNTATDGFLWEVYNSNFIKEKLDTLNKYKNQIDPALR